MDYGMTYATDDQIIGYIDKCGPVTPHPIEITLRFENADEALFCIEPLAWVLRQQKKEFIEANRSARSTEALHNAYVFKQMLRLHDALVEEVTKHDMDRWGSVRGLRQYEGDPI